MVDTQNRFRCYRVEKTAYGKWTWQWTQKSNLNLLDYANWRPVGYIDLEEISNPICREYASCNGFFENKTKDPLLEVSCDNVNGLNENCDRLNFNCPEGLKPTVDYVTCKRKPETKYTAIFQPEFNGVWEFPENAEAQEVKCKKVNDTTDENYIATLETTSEPISPPTSGPEKKLCEDLNEKFFDETVDVSFLVFHNCMPERYQNYS